MGFGKKVAVSCEGFKSAIITEFSHKRRFADSLRRLYRGRGVGLTSISTVNTLGTFATKMCVISRGECIGGRFGNYFRVISLAKAMGAGNNGCCDRLRVDTKSRDNHIFNKRLGRTRVDTATRIMVEVVGNRISEFCSSTANLGLFGFWTSSGRGVHHTLFKTFNTFLVSISGQVVYIVLG